MMATMLFTFTQLADRLKLLHKDVNVIVNLLLHIVPTKRMAQVYPAIDTNFL